MFRQPQHLFRLLALGAVLGALSVWACSVPVFRYALEHWTADPFQAFVFHRGPLTGAQQALVRELGPDGLAGKVRANISIRSVDLDQNPVPEMLDLWRTSGGGALPWLVVKFPATSRLTNTVWSGALSKEDIGQLLDSPARKEITQRLADGQSAVWLLLESGDAAKDAAAAELLDARLKHLTTVLQLPQLDAQDIANGLVSVGQGGLRLEFSVLRLARNAPQEQAFVRMLLGAEADLHGAKSPIVFPIFGQGRALYALVGDGIKRETIDQAAMFLIGKCSCLVKEQNPGIDLLFAADWKSFVKTQTAALPDLPTMAQLTKGAPETISITGTQDASSSTRRPLPASGAIAGGLAFIGLIAVALLLFRRK